MYRADNRPGRRPVLVPHCDVCGRPIDHVDPGGPVIPRMPRPGKDYLVRHAHAGRCLQVVEEELAREQDPGSEKGPRSGRTSFS
jgi:hypothetical protein